VRLKGNPGSEEETSSKEDEIQKPREQKAQRHKPKGGRR